MGKTTKEMVQKIMEQPRKQIVERMMREFGLILTTDQYKKAEQEFLTHRLVDIEYACQTV